MTEGELLMRCREALGYTTQGLARYLDMSNDRRLRRWEHGEQFIPSLLWITVYWMLRWHHRTPETEVMIDQIDDVLRHRRLGNGPRNQRVAAND